MVGVRGVILGLALGDGPHALPQALLVLLLLRLLWLMLLLLHLLLLLMLLLRLGLLVLLPQLLLPHGLLLLLKVAVLLVLLLLLGRGRRKARHLTERRLLPLLQPSLCERGCAELEQQRCAQVQVPHEAARRLDTAVCVCTHTASELKQLLSETERHLRGAAAMQATKAEAQQAGLHLEPCSLGTQGAAHDSVHRPGCVRQIGLLVGHALVREQAGVRLRPDARAQLLPVLVQAGHALRWRLRLRSSDA